ncbi:tryptophan 7-halogenase [Streptomyces sp. NPDC005576]|uniref:tryptophan 7-halogenase n=1 Tax=Streptomyces sp. NPDC005576 TaxID=3364726 RepID=UPI00369D236B
MERRIADIVVVGGTTAGWISAAYLASALRGTARITVVEAPTREHGTDAEADAAATGGVQALPVEMQSDFFDPLGIQESVWMRACRASFRVAARYTNWRTGGPAQWAARDLPHGDPDRFYDPVGGSRTAISAFALPYYWAWRRNAGETIESLDRTCFREPPLLDALKSPRWLDDRAALSYGWHVDTELFTAYLRRVATGRWGVGTARGSLGRAERDARGHVVAVVTTEGSRVAGEFFLDCTGTRAALLAGALGEARTDDPDQLSCDRTVTLTTPADPDGSIAPYTDLLAAPDGWLWRMHLPGRTGVGHVYAAEFTRPEDAARELAVLCGQDPAEADVRHCTLPQGRLRRVWVKNCVALGSSASVVEPLDTSRTGDVLHALRRLVRHLPPVAGEYEAAANRYNREAECRYQADRDFAQLHYAFGPRRDSPFWCAQSARPPSAAVRDLDAAYRSGLPLTGGDLRHLTVLASLDTGPPIAPPALARLDRERREAAEHFEWITRQQRILGETLPSASEYLRRLHGG